MLPFDVDTRSFLLGIAVIAIPAFFVFLVNWLNVKTPSPFKPQVVIQTTKKTPMQVVMGWAGSLLIIAGVGVLLAALFIVLFMNAEWTEVTWMLVVAAVSFLAGVVMRAVLA
jgi:uncharacterized membrane protein